MSRINRFLASTLVSFLLITTCFMIFTQLKSVSFSSASTLPFVNEEYANGTLTQKNSPLLVWYDWINANDTQVIYYSTYTTPEYPYPVPIVNIVGQHLRLADGTEVFVASALDGMEVYYDQNGDDIPQANFTSGDNEILYFMYSNMSDGFSMTPIQKTMEGGAPHYTWAFTYEDVYAYLQNATSHRGVDVRFRLDHFSLSYDFSINGNVTNLKTNFDIGKAQDIQVYDNATGTYVDSADFSLDGLSLSLLYATATYASKPYTTLVDGQPYNSNTATAPALETELAQVTVDDAKAYDFVFGGNYTLQRDASNATHPANIETYEAKAAAAATSSLTTLRLYGPTVRSISMFVDELNLTDLFGGNWQPLSSNYEASSLVYRICFPIWDGMPIVHDPVYVGYVASSAAIPEFTPTVTLPIALVVTVSLVAVFTKSRRTIKKPSGSQ